MLLRNTVVVLALLLGLAVVVRAVHIQPGAHVVPVLLENDGDPNDADTAGEQNIEESQSTEAHDDQQVTLNNGAKFETTNTDTALETTQPSGTETELCRLCAAFTEDTHAVAVAGTVTARQMCTCKKAVQNAGLELALLGQRQQFHEMCDDPSNANKPFQDQPAEPFILPYLANWAKPFLSARCTPPTPEPTPAPTPEATQSTETQQHDTTLANGAKLQTSNSNAALAASTQHEGGPECETCAAFQGSVHAVAVAGTVTARQMCACKKAVQDAGLELALLGQRQQFHEMCDDPSNANKPFQDQPAEPFILPYLANWAKPFLATRCGWNKQETVTGQQGTSSVATSSVATAAATTPKSKLLTVKAPMDTADIWDD